MIKRTPQYVLILLGLISGVIFAFISVRFGIPSSFALKYVKPFGIIFLNALKLTAVPVIFSSLVVGVSSIESTSKVSRMGARTLILYTFTTIVAVVLGLLISGIVQPGAAFPEVIRHKLMALYGEKVHENSFTIQNHSSLTFLIDLVPDNFFKPFIHNHNLLQIIIIAIVFGVAMLRVDKEKRDSVIKFFAAINQILMEIMKLGMKLAPIGVFSLVSSMLIEVLGTNNNPEGMFDLIYSLVEYALATIVGLSMMLFLVYPLLLKIFTEVKILNFLKGIFPAQLVAFTTSSSAASLPVMIENVEKNLKISAKVSRFVLPLGASINMDGSALYLGITISFIAQTLGVNLSVVEQLSVVIYVTLSSIGIGGVPGAAIVTTTILLQLLNLPAAGIALVLIPERILDMCRTVVNVTGDAAVAVVIEKFEQKDPKGGK